MEVGKRGKKRDTFNYVNIKNNIFKIKKYPWETRRILLYITCFNVNLLVVRLGTETSLYDFLQLYLSHNYLKIKSFIL